MEKIKKFVKDNREEIAKGAAVGVVSIVMYTYVCDRLGYRMTRPSHHDENFFYVKTIGGRELRSPRL